MLTVTTKLEVRRERAGRKRLEAKSAMPPTADCVPHIARLMALAIRFKGMLESGVVKDQSELARLARVTQPRMTQILNLNFLAPEIQEAILFLGGDTAVSEKALRPITVELSWENQLQMWREPLSAA
jgi:hypothetical protein